MNSSATDDADQTHLAAQFVSAPRLFAAPEAEQRLTAWLDDIGPAQADGFRDVMARFPVVRAILLGIAEASPYLFDLIRAEPVRALRLLCCEPDAHLATLIEQAALQVVAAGDDAVVM